MDTRVIGQLLSTSLPPEDGISTMLNTLDHLTGSIASSFLPSVMLLVPQPYTTRNKRRVDLCGMVETDTVEFTAGFRYYSSEGEFFYQDGKCGPTDENPCDLVGVIVPEDLSQSIKPVSPYSWVHPQHWPAKAWFSELIPGKTEVQKQGHYLNRMGLIVEIINSSSVDESLTFHDADRKHYDKVGRCNPDQISMYDLIACVRHWSVFAENDWSSDRRIAKKLAGEGGPEMFDPTSHTRRNFTARFFSSMTDTTQLAEQLGIDLGFHMNRSII